MAYKPASSNTSTQWHWSIFYPSLSALTFNDDILASFSKLVAIQLAKASWILLRLRPNPCASFEHWAWNPWSYSQKTLPCPGPGDILIEVLYVNKFLWSSHHILFVKDLESWAKYCSISQYLSTFYKALSIKTACLVNDFGSHVPKTVITRNADVNGSSALA